MHFALSIRIARSAFINMRSALSVSRYAFPIPLSAFSIMHSALSVSRSAFCVQLSFAFFVKMSISLACISVVYLLMPCLSV